MIAFLILLVLTIPIALLRGYVLTHLWGWFITPAFGTPVPGLWICVGLGAILSFITYQSHVGLARDPDSTNGSRAATTIIESIMLSLFAWGFGYLWHLLSL